MKAKLRGPVFAVFAASHLAFAQQAVEKGERIEVTGSRLASSDVESASPIAIIKAEDLKVEGFSSLELILNNYPQFFADQGNRISNGATGTATANLRGLGAQRTLTLLNGRRLPSGDPTLLVPDLNQIPPALIQRVEILTGGASAVYGSDAIAGVVNFILNDRFEGVQGEIAYDFYNHRQKSWIQDLLRARNVQVPGDKSIDGGTTTATLTMGGNFASDKGNAVVSLRYLKSDALLQSDRDYSACPLGRQRGRSALACGGSDAGATGLFVDNSSGDEWTIADAAGHVRPFAAPGDQYNFAPYNYYQRPSERYGANAFVNYEISPAAKLYAEFGFMDDHTVAQIAPTAIFFVETFVPWENPLLSADWRSRLVFTRPDGSVGAGPGTIADVQISRRNVEGGPRQVDLRHTSLREVVGVKGAVADWDYDVFFQTGKVSIQNQFRGDFVGERVTRALDVVVDPATGNAVCRSFLNGSDRRCVPYNVWSLTGVTNEAVAYLQAPAFQNATTSQQVMGATVTGDLGKYGIRFPKSGKGVEAALGVERRIEKLDTANDVIYASGLGSGIPVLDVHGKLEVKDAFGELRVPVLDWLNVNGSYRRSDYAGGNATNTFGAGFNANTVRALGVRGSYQHAVRAPNVVELFSPHFQVPGIYETDPCAGDAPTATLQQCQRTGVTAAQYGHVPDTFFGYPATLGGNEALSAETATTRTLGLVWTLSSTLSATIDAFDIRVKDTIASTEPQAILEQCLETGESRFCTLVIRDPLHGSLFEPGATVIAIGENIGTLRTAGIDLALNYGLKLGGGYRVDIDGMGTYLAKYSFEPFSGSGAVDCRGKFAGDCGSPTPKWRHRLRTTWRAPWGVDLSATWRYTSPVYHVNPSALVPRLPSGTYLDLAVSWAITKRWRLRAGVNNTFDRDPPLFIADSGGAQNGNTFSQVYDALGRHVFMNVTAKF